MMTTTQSLAVALLALAIQHSMADAQSAGDGNPLLTTEHYVKVKSSVPAIAGQTSLVYVREKKLATAPANAPAGGDNVVLFIHGAGTPAEVAFDVPHQDFSWMAFLARAGYDAFAVDMSGYGRSTRPFPMNDPCNLGSAAQAAFVKEPCTPSYANAATTIQSDWDDIDAAVEYIRALRRVDKVSLIAWSLGGPRAGGYTGQHPEKIAKLILLAPAYNRGAAASAPAQTRTAAAFGTQSRAEFDANWNRQVVCPGQYEKATSDVVWSEMLASDPVGATWGTAGGVRRAPSTKVWGWTQAMVAKTMTPTLLVAGVHDAQVRPAGVQSLYDDLGATQKVFVDLACSSHNAMWESNHLLLFRASVEWLKNGSVNGVKAGTLKIGY